MKEVDRRVSVRDKYVRAEAELGVMHSLALELEEGATSKGMQEATQSWKTFFNTLADTSILAQ